MEEHKQNVYFCVGVIRIREIAKDYVCLIIIYIFFGRILVLIQFKKVLRQKFGSHAFCLFDISFFRSVFNISSLSSCASLKCMPFSYPSVRNMKDFFPHMFKHWQFKKYCQTIPRKITY